jgi:hypothetical protein
MTEVAPEDLYLAARATLVCRREDLAIFDEVYAKLHGELPRVQPAPPAPRHPRTALQSWMAERADPASRESDVPEEAKTASPLERLARKDFAACTPDELEALARAMRDCRFELTRRDSLRLARARRGDRLDLPRAVREAARHGGKVLRLPKRRRKPKHRPLVVLADISGSMELYARLLLQFLHGLTRRHPHTETFTFGTRLTRITPQLQLRDPGAALRHAGREIVDFAGGTRIGASLAEFNRQHARRVLRRGAVLLLISDGWETGEPAALAKEMRRLAGRSHRVIWLNPLLGGKGYEPRARGMAAALPHVDDFLPVHDLHSLRQLSAHLARIPRRKGAILS